jgi:signal transduction histidine kinase
MIMTLSSLPTELANLSLSALSCSILMATTFIGWLENQFRRSSSSLIDQHQIQIAHSFEQKRTLAREVERLQIVLKMATALNSTLNYERVLEMALDLATSALAESKLDETRIKSAVLLFEDDRLRVASARGLSKADRKTTLPGELGVIAEALNCSESCVSHDPPLDPELRLLTAFHTCKAAVCLPLNIGLKVYGVFVFGHRKPYHFNHDRLTILETIAQQAMIALQNARLYRELEQEKERIMEIQEEARKKLARDLHDGPTQSIAAIAMRVNFVRRLMERDPKATLEELHKVESIARRTTNEIRQMLFTLRPLILETKGLVAAVRHLANKIEQAHHQSVNVEAAEDVAEGLSANKQAMAFHIAEEALNNARKHAQAKHIWVRLARDEDVCLLEIEDDGKGFNLGAIDSGYENLGSLGLVNMRERAELVNGLLQIESEPGHGTLITLAIPITESAAERLQRPGFSLVDFPSHQPSAA